MKYTRYAIGEILLVVIGILIALSINNWNEERKAKKELENYLIQMMDELSKDVDFYNNVTKGNEQRIGFLTSASQGNYSEINIESLLEFLATNMAAKNFGITYKSLIAEGMLNDIENTKLKNKITNYYEFKCLKYSEWVSWHEKFVTEIIESYLVLNLPIRSGRMVNSEKVINEIENGQLLSMINYQIFVFESASDLMKRNTKSAKELTLLIESEIH